MPQANVLKGLTLSREIPFRDPDALFSLAVTDGMGRSAYLPVGQSMLERHMLLLGSAGTGKTNLLMHLARNLRANLTQEDALVIFDPTGVMHRTLWQKGDVTLSDDDRACGPEGEDAWNLFEELSDEQRVVEDATALCETLFRERIEASAHPFSPTAARDLTLALMVFLCRQKDDSLRSNRALRELIDGFDLDTMVRLLNGMPEFRAFAGYLGDGDRAQGVVATLQQSARELLSGRFALEGRLSMRKLVRQRAGRVIFICYDPVRGALTRPVFAALLDLCLTEALARRERPGNLYMLLDDVSVLPALAHLEDALRLGRDSGLRLILSFTGMGGLEARYAAAAASMRSAVGTTAAFQLLDRPSRDYVKSLYGRHRVVETYRSTVQRGMVEQVVDEYVISDEDLTTLPTGDCILCTLHHPPFFFRLKLYGTETAR